MPEAATAQQFIDALQVVDRDRDPTDLKGFLTENGEAGNIVSSREVSGCGRRPGMLGDLSEQLR